MEKATILQQTILDNQYVPFSPSEKQWVFLSYINEDEVFYGGAANGGKSFALLMAALMFVNFPNYNAILFRRTYRDLSLPDALMDLSHQWLDDTDATWHEILKTWRFPSGATLTFGYLDNENDKFRYQGAQFHFIGFDELSQFTESQYLYLFSRLRRKHNDPIPLRMRAASNPGGVGHDFVKRRFILSNRPFIPAKLTDNPFVDHQEYKKALDKLDHITRQQLLLGDWDISPEGALFKREWFQIVNDYPREAHKARYWDLAATTATASDYTAGALVAEHDGVYYILDVARFKQRPAGVENAIQQAAELDGKEIRVFMEQEPGASGVNTIDHYARYVLVGYSFKGNKTTGSKISRAAPVSSAAEAGNVKIVSKADDEWVRVFLDEASLFPGGPHDDQVDAVSGAVAMLVAMKKKEHPVIMPVIVGRGEGRWSGLH